MLMVAPGPTAMQEKLQDDMSEIQLIIDGIGMRLEGNMAYFEIIEK